MRQFLLLIAFFLAPMAARAEVAVFAGGCFWCVEADMDKVPGVSRTISGFTGGSVANPTYKDVTKGGTGHYEAVEVTFDPARTSYADLVAIFLRSIDPLDAGGQFCDRGESYRTAIFVKSDAQRQAATEAVAAAGEALGRKIVTPVLRAQAFFPADEYHQDYYRQGDVILTRAGPKSKKSAYKFYRDACGRDAQVKAVWGDQAAFAK